MGLKMLHAHELKRVRDSFSEVSQKSLPYDPRPRDETDEVALARDGSNLSGDHADMSLDQLRALHAAWLRKTRARPGVFAAGTERKLANRHYAAGSVLAMAQG